MDGLRKDAARNRERIVDAARRLLADGKPVGLNAVARAADVGVGTVYRHFAGVEELEETLAWDRFDELADLLDEDGDDVLGRAIAAHVRLMVEDPVFERVMSRPQPHLEETARKRDALLARVDTAMARARERGDLRPGMGAGDVVLLVCGLAYAVRHGGLGADDPQARLAVQVVLDGLRPG
ncbi:TetR/AcrR family transcriptional regulator [Cellulomonas sp. Sa3CUA2]|uniref:TetR/AcrR family transcriptional regulator n=1 Tax=Cellulomonas avistercoris TaxID=2762242 RepID=A0ABR8QHT6_9CELL|nr:TetR/AcrR family transcriptional regulator [Cellulomonas avistercoris]MBD7919921.1 TetR/AcrR family transcriptional regulator [Cellulomonas avistercoris]